MSPRAPFLAPLFALSACFNPTGQTPGATDASTTTTGVTAATAATATTDVGTTGSEVTTAVPTTSVGTSTGGETGTTGMSPCGVCLESAPYCVPTGECVSCLDLPAHELSCGTVDPAKPWCDETVDGGSGLCVECLSTSDCEPSEECHPQLKKCVECVDSCAAPLKCDTETNTCVVCLADADCAAQANHPVCDEGVCRACREHSECPDTACELDLGSCFPPKETHHWWVADTMMCVDSMCTDSAPCCEIASAVAGINPGDERWHVIHVAAGNYESYFALATGPRRVAILAEEGAVLKATEPTKPAILVGDNVDLQHIDASLYVSRLRITGGPILGFSCNDATGAYLDDVKLFSITNNAAYASNCPLQIRRSEIIRNNGGVMAATGGRIRIENSVLAGVTIAPNLTVITDGELDLVYTSVGLQTPVAAGLLYCTGGKVNVRNSALLTSVPGMFVDCMPEELSITYSAVSQDSLVPMEGNVPVDPGAVEEPFVSYIDSDLHIKLGGDGGPLKNVARWSTNDPKTDIDGAPRPNVDGTLDVAGADLPGR